jgi:hypothetical protein
VAGELTRETILEAFARLNDALKQEGVTGEICLLEGTVMVLGFKARARTKDVDAIFEPASVIRKAAKSVSEKMNLPGDWLNDGAKGFISSRHDVSPGDLPQFDHLRLTAPTAEYMFALKCLASRLPASSTEKGDENDIRFLARHLHLKTAEQAMDLVSRYYPPERIPARTQFLLEDIFQSPERV